MSQCVPSWDINDVSPNCDVPKLDHEVAELTWENGHLAMHGFGPRHVPNKPQYAWDKPLAGETLEAIVNQATLFPHCKPQIAVTGDDLVPWLHHRNSAVTVAAGSVNASATMTTDALVPSSNHRTDERSAHVIRPTNSVRDAGCSTRVGSCSGDPSAFVKWRVARGGGGGTTATANGWSSCRDKSVSGSETFGTVDTSSGSPENTSSGKNCTKSTSPDDSICHWTPQRETNEVNEKKRGKGKFFISSKRSRIAAIHNQSERKRRDKINQRMKTLQKLVPNSSKTDKASMLDEVIEYLKQLQAQVHMINRMNMPSMMMPLAMQQQMHMSMMNSMSMMNPMGMGMGMGMGVMDMNTIGRPNIPSGFHPSAFMHMPPWDGHTTDRVANATPMTADPMSAFLASRSQPINMDAYHRMAALFQHIQNQQCGALPNN